MPVAARVKWYLDRQGVDYSVIPHPPTESSLATAEAAHVETDRLAKCILLEDERGYVLTVLPASHRLALDALNAQFGRRLGLATEPELADIFDDCALGAVPPCGSAYGIPTVVDESLLHLRDVCFEGGDHEHLVKMTGADFASLFSGMPHGAYSVEGSSTDVATSVRAKGMREQRLDQAFAHVFSLRSYGAGLRRQPEYDKGGHTGMILMKTPELRVLLEAMSAERTLATHVVHGPTTLLVLEGALDVETRGRMFRVGESEMAVLPRDTRREIRAAADSLFLIALSPLRAIDQPTPTGRPAEVGTAAAPRRILIVANRSVGGRHLDEAVRARVRREACEFVVLCPASPSRSALTWNERSVRQEARERLDRACDRLTQLGARVDGVVGDFDPMAAIRDLLLVEDFDEIIVSTLPASVSEWLRLDLPSRVSRRFGLPVTHIASPE
jgi:Ala-tRNA(Pro) deacylase